MKVYCVEWEEYEDGWGSRPDGYSCHTTAEGRDKFIKTYDIDGKIHTSMPLRLFEVFDPALFEKASNNKGYVFVNKI